VNLVEVPICGHQAQSGSSSIEKKIGARTALREPLQVPPDSGSDYDKPFAGFTTHDDDTQMA